MNKLAKLSCLFSILLSCLILLPQAQAMTLDQARSAGYIGEQYDGYLGVVKPGAPQDALGQMKSVNEKRRVYYQTIARNNKIPLIDVETAAGGKLMHRVPNGEFVKYSNSSWVKK